MPSKWMKDFLAKKYEDHRKRVREARTTLDKQKPPQMPMSMRREMERKRVQSSIEQDNRLLMDRLGLAMSHKNIDNELKAKPFVSYIELQRKKDMIRVTTENRRLLDRIQKTNPSYNHLQWEADAERRVHYLKTMSQFPDHFVPPGVHRPGYQSKRAQERERMRNRIGAHPFYSQDMGGEGEEQLQDAVDEMMEEAVEALAATHLSPRPPQDLMDHSEGHRPSRPFSLPPI